MTWLWQVMGISRIYWCEKDVDLPPITLKSDSLEIVSPNAYVNNTDDDTSGSQFFGRIQTDKTPRNGTLQTSVVSVTGLCWTWSNPIQ